MRSIQKQLAAAGLVAEPRGPGLYDITGYREHDLKPPARLELDDQLLAAHLSLLARQEGGVAEHAIGLLVVHIEEEVDSSIAMKRPLYRLGLRRSKIRQRPEWFVESGESQLDGPEADPNATYEWRA